MTVLPDLELEQQDTLLAALEKNRSAGGLFVDKVDVYPMAWVLVYDYRGEDFAVPQYVVDEGRILGYRFAHKDLTGLQRVLVYRSWDLLKHGESAIAQFEIAVTPGQMLDIYYERALKISDGVKEGLAMVVCLTNQHDHSLGCHIGISLTPDGRFMTKAMAINRGHKMSFTAKEVL